MKGAGAVSAARRLAAVDGMRSLAHISLIALHSAMLLTGKLPSEGPLWTAFKSRLPFTVFQAGGIQVDVFFMLAALLMASGLLRPDPPRTPSVLAHGLRRALRMLPMMIMAIVLGHYVMGECWGEPYTHMDGGKSVFPDRVMSLVLFYTNYCDQLLVGSFLGSLMWSCAVDLQVGVAMVLIIKLAGRVCKDRASLLRTLRWVFAALAVLACGVRGLLFDKDTVNMVMLGQYFHFGLLQPRSSYTWMADFFGHVWHTSNSAVHTTHAYLNNMYFPTHTRFGPFAVGGFLACSLAITEEASRGKPATAVRSSVMDTALCWACTAAALAVLVVPCVPAPPVDEVPLVAQLIVTAALRNVSAAAAALLLYRCLVPPSHPWHSPWISSLLSLPVWAPVAEITYCSYLIHFRQLMQIIYSDSWRAALGIALPAVVVSADGSPGQLAGEWILVMVKVFLAGLVVSFAAAKVLYELIEKPSAAAINMYVFSSAASAPPERGAQDSTPASTGKKRR